jgi:hypothetical protein
VLFRCAIQLSVCSERDRRLKACRVNVRYGCFSFAVSDLIGHSLRGGTISARTSPTRWGC